MKSSRRLLPDTRLAGLVEVRESGIHGRGVFALRRIPRGALLGTYEGRRYSEQEAARATFDSALTYLFALSDGSTIDGGQGGNATRHLNHACAPNCEAREVATDGVLQLRIHALTRIEAGEELFLDYALVIDDSEDSALYPCNCGHADCRGSMAAQSA
ncbi:MAG: SET domain-containing protein-lysine N-methyltransferase [Burkholderiaceae bacterium]